MMTLLPSRLMNCSASRTSTFSRFGFDFGRNEFDFGNRIIIRYLNKYLT